MRFSHTHTHTPVNIQEHVPFNHTSYNAPHADFYKIGATVNKLESVVSDGADLTCSMKSILQGRPVLHASTYIGLVSVPHLAYTSLTHVFISTGGALVGHTRTDSLGVVCFAGLVKTASSTLPTVLQSTSCSLQAARQATNQRCQLLASSLEDCRADTT
jgi:hypothetical protein